MNIQKIDHIAIAVSDLEKSTALYRDIFKLPYHGTQTLEDQKVKVAFFTCGDTEIELVQALTPDAAVNRFIEKQGEGLYHIAFQVDDAAEAMQYLSEKGLKLGSEGPAPGANETKVGFVRRSSTGGVIVELVEHAE
ncbi:MAG: VOC family protein [Firmicutes bacterium]|nr:VOC family protein [Bacillota bacterium]